MSEKRIDTLRLVHLKAFLLVIECGSQVKAAKEAGCAQSTFSRYLNALQFWLRRPLFDETVPLVLSEDGAKLEVVARKVVEMLDAVQGPKTGPRIKGSDVVV